MARLPGDPSAVGWLRFAAGFRLPPENRIGTMPSQRADLATGRGAGRTPPTHTGILGR